jgi:hypothetical protein
VQAWESHARIRPRLCSNAPRHIRARRARTVLTNYPGGLGLRAGVGVVALSDVTAGDRPKARQSGGERRIGRSRVAAPSLPTRCLLSSTRSPTISPISRACWPGPRKPGRSPLCAKLTKIGSSAMRPSRWLRKPPETLFAELLWHIDRPPLGGPFAMLV